MRTPSRRLSLAFVVLSILAIAACVRPTRTARAPRPGRPSVTVMTFNVNFGLAGDRNTVDAIRQGGADVVLLQETTPEWEQALRADLHGPYPRMAFRHCCRAGGLGVLSKWPFREMDYIPAPSGWFPAWRLIVETPLGGLQVLVVHLRPPVSDAGSYVSGYFNTPPIREREIAAYFGRLDPSLPTIVAGDFNEGDGGRAVAFLAARNLRSVLPEFHPEADTWRWTTSVGTIRGRLDHILYDPRLDPLDARVLPFGRSDHLPVVVTFERASRN